MLNKNPSPEAAVYAVTRRVLAVSRQKLARSDFFSGLFSKMTRCRLSQLWVIEREDSPARKRWGLVLVYITAPEGAAGRSSAAASAWRRPRNPLLCDSNYRCPFNLY